MRQNIQEWDNKNLWNATFEKIKEVLSIITILLQIF